MTTKEEILDHLAILNDCYLDDRYRTTALQAMQEYADTYHREKLRDMCTCGGYPECICDITKNLTKHK